MNSKTLPLYATWLAEASPRQIAFVDDIFALCERNYEAGGDVVVECMAPSDVLRQFKNVREAKRHCLLHVEQRKNARWGDDTDPELNIPKWKD